MSVFRFPGDLQETDQAAKPCVFRIGQTRSSHSTLDPDGERNGGASRDRTDDLMLAKQPLSQLSYGPNRECGQIVGANGGPGTTRTSDLTLIRGAL